jgi:hypothetical protein
LEKELRALCKYLDSKLTQENIIESNTNMGGPIIFVSKPNGKLQLWVDFRRLNAVTVKNSYPLLLMDKLRDKVVGCEWFTMLDLRDRDYLV